MNSIEILGVFTERAEKLSKVHQEQVMQISLMETQIKKLEADKSTAIARANIIQGQIFEAKEMQKHFESIASQTATPKGRPEISGFDLIREQTLKLQPKTKLSEVKLEDASSDNQLEQ